MSNVTCLTIEHLPLTIEDVLAVSAGECDVVLSDEATFVKCILDGRDALEHLKEKQQVVYGVTTGVGDSCTTSVSKENADQFALNLLRFHGCGMGEYLDERTSKAVLLVRLASLKTGFSAVRLELLQFLTRLLQLGITPRIPAEGSVGASGDLTPLSYVAAVVVGEREVYHNGEVRPTKTVFDEQGITPLALKAKEALAIMNGTSVMTAIACIAYARAARLVRLGAAVTAMLVEVLQVNKGHFDLRIFEQKPHPGQLAVARQICRQVKYDANYQLKDGERIQATYAVRCAPHILGVLEDSLGWMRQFIETEINSVNDNPLIDPKRGDVLHGGNFYGGHIAFAMDSMKNAVANLADLFDRQMALLVNERKNNGLPPNLSGAPVSERSIHHGFKAVHIATSAFASEALKGAMPASVFSRSTESNNQDKVSLGTISARDCIRVLELTEQNLAALLLAAAQGIDLRVRAGEMSLDSLHPELVGLYTHIRACSDFVAQDRALESDLRTLVSDIASGRVEKEV
ncbi:MAG: aromatic amino acid lyase [Deltaproteobacteria bacterium]|nr:aromatic amino acid lyase [Deltaproteobacteria bacterium]MBN2673291.1 aromatic amino acid lyase [Deltaproteobacteria bacterium]